MEASLSDLSEVLKLDEVVHIYERWFRNTPRGFALLSYQREPTRQDFLGRLGGQANELRFVDLSREISPKAVVEAMASALEASDAVVFFGFEEALEPTPDNARLLNYNRERFARFDGRQLWVLGPVWRLALLGWAFDLYSWFLPSNLIGQIQGDQAPET